MKKIKLIIIFIIFFSNNLLLSIEGQIILKVENKIITSFQLKNKVLSSLLLNNQNINQINIDNLKSQTIDTLILVKLKEIEIEKYNLERKEGDLAMRMNDYLNKISSNNIPNIKNVFKNNGVDFDMFKAEIETEFL